MAVVRGSDRLLEAWTGAKSNEISEEFVRLLAEALREYELTRILMHGTPRPDVVEATIKVAGEDPEPCGIGLVRILNAFRKSGVLLGHVRVFPNGVPPVIDGWRIAVHAGEGENFEVATE